ncbi:membrane protein insertase YidC [Formosa algae]|uniref:Membrane protein insertase YidC n=1 Tax=Formosa algae TaxID=225843 RepID=A0A9X0YQC6_9FLAO|nr:membrane protein insertase YidC [Formosa algae]MBP1841437.1 YidC/Oxa1 family membrane protein insertase [Formosa algae]MDQ0336641.1 YidC/Oxa1 family membrane protein insertase [Formosa algae]OEI81899.1 membrane protein insertase YidC [Formosa algae]
MEEKKLDLNSVIGFVLIFGILMFMLWQNQPTPEELEAQEQAKQEQVEAEKKANVKDDTLETSSEDFSVASATDSLQLVGLKNKLGAFAYSSTLPSATNNVTEVETELFDLKFSNKGGFLSEIRLKKFDNYDSLPVYLIKDKSAAFNINFNTTDSRVLNTQDLYFQPTISKNGANTVVSMKLKVSESKFLEYRYELKPDNYMMDFTIRSQGLSDVINSTQDVNLNWKQKMYRGDKSVEYENRYTRLTYQHDGGKIDKLSPTSDDDDVEEDVTWLSYRQHFFSSILVTQKPFKTADLISENLLEKDDDDAEFTKLYESTVPLAVEGGEINAPLKFYFGPTDNTVLKQYEYSLDDSIPFGWGIFGWINRYVFVPVFAFLSGLMPYGFAIIVMTILVRIVMSPVTYKSYLSQAKMKILKPEINEINEKYKDNAMKKQQETMALYSKAGASPMAGCLPGLLQIPVFYALFQFFPSAFDLRHKSFLWAEDLSSYDTIAELPFKIPFYGDHISLFPILASVAIFFYMKMTTGQQAASQPTQEGMPDMGKMMKYMIYFSPLMMLVFFNNYASGLSLYYFISNLITIGIMLVIKNFIIDEDKIHAKIQENKKKPKKENRFQKKMKDMMEQAEQQKQSQNRKK